MALAVFYDGYFGALSLRRNTSTRSHQACGRCQSASINLVRSGCGIVPAVMDRYREFELHCTLTCPHLLPAAGRKFLAVGIQIFTCLLTN
jgi:hypothetical protein